MRGSIKVVLAEPQKYPEHAFFREQINVCGFGGGELQRYAHIIVQIIQGDLGELPTYMGIDPMFDRYIEERLRANV